VGRRVVTGTRRARLRSGVVVWVRRRQNGLIALVAVAVSGALVLSATNAAFTATTINPGNAYAAGTVTLSDNDAGTAMFNPSNLKPGDSYSSCIQVSYTGSLPSLVKLYGTTGGTGLAAYLDLTITRGTISSGSFGDCTNFTADATNYLGAGAGIIYGNTLANVPTTVGAAVNDPHAAAVPEAWTTSEVHAYKFTATLQDNNAAQGLTATENFTWQAVNTTSYSQVILSDGPASYWRLNEASGTTAADSAGTNDGTYYNGAAPNAPGPVKDAGTAATFDGVDDMIGVPNAAGLDPTSAISVEVWVRPSAIGTGYQNISDKGGQYLLRVDNTAEGSRLSFFVTIAGNPEPRISGPVLTAGTLYHVVGTYDGSNVRLYVDGTLAGTVARTGPIDVGTLPLEISHASEGINATIDEVAFYDYALTGQQVAEHYGAGKR
jgi:hypothetical protein